MLDRKVYDFNNRKMVFIDWRYVYPGYGSKLDKNENILTTSDSIPYGVYLRTIPCRLESNPTFKPEKPWEMGYVSTYSTVIQDEGKLKLYYEIFVSGESEKWSDHNSLFCYAESKDGDHWERPNLGIVEFDGNSNNSILVTPNTNPVKVGVHGAHVFIDPHAELEEKYKLNYCGPRGKMYGAFSSDGLHWNFRNHPIADTEADSQNIVYWDPKSQKYIGYFRTWSYERRGIVRAESEDFWNWPSFDTFQMLYLADPNQTPDSDYYTNAFHLWPGTEDQSDVQLMFPSVYHRTEDYLVTETYTSQNGKQWFRPSPNPINSPYESILKKQGALYFGKGIWNDSQPGIWNIFTSNYPQNHNDIKPSFPYGALYKAQFREDGFMGITTDNIGEFWTARINSQNSKILINAVTNNAGRIQIGLVDSLTRKELDEFTLEECDLLNGDLLWKEVTWNGEHDITDYDDVQLRLHVKMKMATIFALKFVD